MKFLKYVDFFDTKFHFYVGGHPTNSSIFGGIMSLIFCVLSIIILLIFAWQDLNKLNPITSKSEIPGGEIRVVNLHNSKVWVPFRMVTYEEKFIDHRGVLHPVVSFIEGKWNSSFGMDLTYHTLEYKLCSETSMANKTKEYKIDIPLNEIFCIDNDDFPWGGSWHGDFLYYFEVNLYLCEDGIDFNSYWGMTNVYGDSYFMPEEKDNLVKSTSSRLYSLVVYMDQGYVHYTRKYKSIFYIFSEILPLINVLLIVFKKFTRYIKLIIARKNISGYIFENIQINNNEQPILNVRKKTFYEMKPLTKFRPSKNFLNLKKNVPENNRSSIVNLNADSINNPNQITREKTKSNRLKLALNKNGNENNENNAGDVNIIGFLNKSQLKRKTINDPNNVSMSIASINNIFYKRKNDGNKNLEKSELFPISYFYMNLIFDRLIKPKGFFCLDKRYFIMYNFMVKIFDVSSHIKLLKYFTIFTDYFFSNELNGKKRNFPYFERKININDDKKMEEIENIGDKDEDIFGKFIFYEKKE